jgi:DNA-binding MarR family transcriptional regulator/GNAT superfamily N-acetyltransferase
MTSASTPSTPSAPSAVRRIREFNRGWTELLGLLDQGLLATEYSLPEARVLFELAQRPSWERLALRDRLGMDASFLTRVLRGLSERGLVTTTPSRTDGRALNLALSQAGRVAARLLDARSAEQIDQLLAPLTTEQRRRLTESMTVISALVRPAPAERQVTLRGLEPGDLGWVVERHGAVYHQEYGWDAGFESLVARIVADYHDGLKPDRENAWIAEVDGARAGCVFCCEADARTARLRLLLVEPWARGLRLGTRLVDECVHFAREAGYDTMTLWTNDVLTAARRIYQAAGFQLTDSDPHHSFGHDLTGQNWQLDLR